MRSSPGSVRPSDILGDGSSDMKLSIVVLLWIVALWRAPSARHEPWKRALWLALTALAAALTFSLDPVTRLIDQLSGVTDLAALLKHLTGILACAGVLDWVIALTRPQAGSAPAKRHALAAFTALTMAVLFFQIDRSTPGDFTTTMAGDPTGTAYLLVFEGYLALAMGMATATLITAAARAPRGLLRWGLWILATGTALGVAYTAVRSAFLLLRLSEAHASDGAQTLYSLSERLQLVAIVFILAGSSLPAMNVALTAGADYLALNALRPLWLQLATSIPQVVLGAPPTRRSDLTAPRDLRIRLLRRTIEIHDARLVLRSHVREQDLQWARTELTARGLTGAALDAATEAVWLRAAVQARAAGIAAETPDLRPTPNSSDLAGEVRWLRMVTTALRDPNVTAVTDRLTLRLTRK